MDTCPAYDHKLTTLRDFPVIYVADFKRVELPRYIGVHTQFIEKKVSRKVGWFTTAMVDNPLIPPAVLNRLQGDTNDFISFDGYIYQKDLQSAGYIKRSQDITEAIRELVASPPIQEAFSSLESVVGTEIETKELVAKLHLGSCFTRNFSIELSDSNDQSNGNKKAKINLCGLWSYSRSYAGSSPELRQPLAEFWYEGRIRH